MKKNAIYVLACLLFFMTSCQKTELLEVQGGEATSLVQGKKDGIIPVGSPAPPVVDYKIHFNRYDDELVLEYEGVETFYDNAYGFSWNVNVEDNAGGVPAILGGDSDINPIVNPNPLIPFNPINGTFLNSDITNFGAIPPKYTTYDLESTTNQITLPHNGIETIFHVNFSAIVNISGTITPITHSITLSVFPNHNGSLLNGHYTIQIIDDDDLIPLLSSYSGGGPGLGVAVIGVGG